ncbi:MAG: HAMP domain-containing protein, partial [Parvibaculaceae bacterium]|nr:HAMP domain-containing protein [Parvibaculaceae bacterium]
MQLSNTLTNFWLGLVRLSRKRGVAPAFSVGIVVFAVFLGAYTFMALTGTLVAQPERTQLILLLVTNLVVFIVLLGLVVWRFVKIYLATRSGNAGAKLHGRMVTLFTAIAGGPAIIVAIYASVALEGGLENVFGHQVQLLVNNTNKVAGAYLNEHRMVLNNDLQLMKSDLNGQSALYLKQPEKFKKFVEAQVGVRSLNDAYIINRKGAILSRSSANLMPSQRMPSEAVMAKVAAGTTALYTDIKTNQVKALVKLDSFPDAYLFISRFVDPRVLSHVQNANEITQRFKMLRDQRSQSQLTFMIIYIILALVVVFAAIWIGLWVANRIVTPIGNLMDAAEKVSVGDLTARVRVDRAGEDDEIDLLSRAFNRMTKQLESQRSDLVEANEQIDDRRRFTEAVLAGVSAGIIGLDRTGRIDHTNQASLKFLDRDAISTNGELITDIIPEMSAV